MVRILIMILVLCIYLKENEDNIDQLWWLWRATYVRIFGFRELFHYWRKPICFWTLDISHTVIPIGTFLSCRMTSSIKKLSQMWVFFRYGVENLLPSKSSEVTPLFWQQMAVFSGTMAMCSLATEESSVTFPFRTARPLSGAGARLGAPGPHRTLFYRCACRTGFRQH